MTNWDKDLTRTLVQQGLSWDHARIAVGETAEHRQIADRQGYIRGFNDGAESKKTDVYIVQEELNAGSFIGAFPTVRHAQNYIETLENKKVIVKHDTCLTFPTVKDACNYIETGENTNVTVQQHDTCWTVEIDEQILYRIYKVNYHE
jgi:hypothetical protein